MPRYKLTVAYDGTGFHGWQKQNSSQSPESPVPGGTDEVLTESVRTVQSVLEETVRRVVREPVDLVGASRTDSGVHACGQVAAFTTAEPVRFSVEKIPAVITSRLPDDVQVTKCEAVSDDFDPIRDAVAKKYRFRIAYGSERIPPLFDRHFLTTTRYDLNVESMNRAAMQLLGEHDFASFARINHGRETTVRMLYECEVTHTANGRCNIDVVGNGFLYNMVRIIAGTLVEVGRGKIKPSEIPKIIDARDRTAAGPTLTPEGLCLMWIKYSAHS